jgi:cohesin complex subunit SA-1/2
VRPFRYAATVTSVQLVSSWNRVQAALTEARETAQFQLAAEEKKAGKVGGVAWSSATSHHQPLCELLVLVCGRAACTLAPAAALHARPLRCAHPIAA